MRVRRDADENVQDQAIDITTPSILDTIKSGLQKTFSDENVNVSSCRNI